VELVKVLTDAEWQKKQTEKEAKKQAEKARTEQEEAQAIQKYMKDNNITPTTVLPSGLIYVEKQAGSGPKPVTGKKVKVQYTGKFLNGTTFDSSVGKGEPLEFPIGQRAVIEGWDLGIALMSQGTKALLIVPSKLAYKERGYGDAIPPNSTLVFEVELVEIEK
jgi:FKBP-type peptidyl-prolyl cis-trans isomerase